MGNGGEEVEEEEIGEGEAEEEEGAVLVEDGDEGNNLEGLVGAVQARAVQWVAQVQVQELAGAASVQEENRGNLTH